MLVSKLLQRGTSSASLEVFCFKWAALVPDEVVSPTAHFFASLWTATLMFVSLAGTHGIKRELLEKAFARVPGRLSLERYAPGEQAG